MCRSKRRETTPHRKQKRREKMKKQIITLTVAALTLSSCGIYTQYKPATEVPDNLYGEEVAVADTVDNIGNLSWQEIFTDPRLQELIEQGLRNNTDLQSAQWRVKEAEAAMLSAKLAYLPSFALSPQGTASSFDKGKAVQTYTLPVAASWEIDIFGRIRNAKRQAKALLEQSRDYKQAVRTQLIAGIANTYYTLLMLDNQLAISVRTEKSWKETVDATRALMEAGLANEAAVSQMEATYYTICTSVLDLKEQINQVENSLSLLLAVPFGLMGSFLFAKMMGLENNIYLQTGLIMLIGLLAKTAILLTEYATERRKAGMSLTSAALSAAKARLRPILMTALTMIFGLFPLMVASGVGANGNSSLGTGTVGGMVIGTLALLFIVPSLFIVFQYLQEKVRPIQFQPAADWQIQEECVEAKEERQHHIESKNEEKK
jgi:hypothetical protein